MPRNEVNSIQNTKHARALQRLVALMDKCGLSDDQVVGTFANSFSGGAELTIGPSDRFGKNPSDKDSMKLMYETLEQALKTVGLQRRQPAFSDFVAEGELSELSAAVGKAADMVLARWASKASAKGSPERLV